MKFRMQGWRTDRTGRTNDDMIAQDGRSSDNRISADMNILPESDLAGIICTVGNVSIGRDGRLIGIFGIRSEQANQAFLGVQVQDRSCTSNLYRQRIGKTMFNQLCKIQRECVIDGSFIEDAGFNEKAVRPIAAHGCRPEAIIVKPAESNQVIL
jgi:hypothetical protein